MRRSTLLLFLFVSILSQQAWAGQDSQPSAKAKASKQAPSAQTTPEINRLSATIRSAIVPGWGQWYRGQGWLGASYLALFAASIAGTEYYSSLGDSTYAKYQSATSSADASSLYDQTRQQDQLYTDFSYAILGIYAVNVLDALIFTGMGHSDAHAANPYVPQLQTAMLDRKNMGLVLRWQL